MTETKKQSSVAPMKAPMKWEKASSSEWKAAGKFGAFFIKKSCGKFWPRYVSSSGRNMFRMPPCNKLTEAKNMCEDNDYWEDA